MQVGVFDRADYVTKVKMLTFPNYSDPAFPKKWKNMGDSVAFPVEELPSEAEGKKNYLHVLTCTNHTKGRPTRVYAWRFKNENILGTFDMYAKKKCKCILYILVICFLGYSLSSEHFL